MANYNRFASKFRSMSFGAHQLVSEPLDPAIESSRGRSSSHGGSGGGSPEGKRVLATEERISSLEDSVETLSGNVLDFNGRFNKFEERFDKFNRMLEELVRSKPNSEVLNQNLNQTPSLHHSTAAQPVIKFKLPDYDGEGNVNVWLLRISHYFKCYNIPEEDRIEICSVQLKGTAAYWLEWTMKIRNGMLSWEEFFMSIRRDFDPSQFSDHMIDLKLLHQDGNVQEYNSNFQKLSKKIHGLSEYCLVRQYVGGLKEEVRYEVQVANPINLLAAMRLAILSEAKITAAKRHYQALAMFLGNSNDSSKDVDASDDNTEESGKVGDVPRAVCSSSSNEKGGSVIEPKTRSSFSSMNALVEGCVKFSESAALSDGNDLGMNLFATDATTEISKSGLVPSSMFPGSSPTEDKPCADVKPANQGKVAGLVSLSEELYETSMHVVGVSKIDAPVEQLLESSWGLTNIAAGKTEVQIWDPGQIGYALVPMIAQGTILGPVQSVILHMLDISPAAEVVRLMQGLASVSEQDEEVDFIVDVLVSGKLTLPLEKNIFIFDLGGGTLDVSIITIDNEAFEVLSTNGDTHLGSEDLDQRIMEYYIKLIKEKSQIFTTYQDQQIVVFIQDFEGEKRLPKDCRSSGLLQYKAAAVAMHAGFSTRLWDQGTKLISISYLQNQEDGLPNMGSGPFKFTTPVTDMGIYEKLRHLLPGHQAHIHLPQGIRIWESSKEKVWDPGI